jgi:hypothetical protein
MSIAERIKARTSQKRHLDVPEWGEDGKPERVYYGPLLAGELNRIQRKHPNFLQSASFEAMVDLIVLKAEDGQGGKMFTLEDKPILMREEVSVISTVAASMMGGSESVEDHEKN